MFFVLLLVGPLGEVWWGVSSFFWFQIWFPSSSHFGSISKVEAPNTSNTSIWTIFHFEGNQCIFRWLFSNHEVFWDFSKNISLLCFPFEDSFNAPNQVTRSRFLDGRWWQDFLLFRPNLGIGWIPPLWKQSLGGSNVFGVKVFQEGHKERCFFPTKDVEKPWKCCKVEFVSKKHYSKFFLKFSGTDIFSGHFLYEEFCSMANSSEKVCQIAHDWAMRPIALSLLFIQQNSFLEKIVSCKMQEWWCKKAFIRNFLYCAPDGTSHIEFQGALFIWKNWKYLSPMTSMNNSNWCRLHLVISITYFISSIHVAEDPSLDLTHGHSYYKWIMNSGITKSITTTSLKLQKFSFDLKMVHSLTVSSLPPSWQKRKKSSEVYPATCTAMDQQLLLFLSQILRMKPFSELVSLVTIWLKRH